MGFDNWPTSSYPPLDKSAKGRFEAAGMAKYHETFYSMDSGLAHMSARAVQRYLDGDFDEEKVHNDLTLATDMLLRILIAANERNKAGLDERIDGLVREFRRAASPDSVPGVSRCYLRT